MPKRKIEEAQPGGPTQSVNATAFQAKPGLYQDMTENGPLIIEKYSRPKYVLLSFKDYQKLTGNTKRALHVSQIPPDDLALIAAAEVPEEYADLD